MNAIILLSQLLFTECGKNCPKIESNIIDWTIIDKKYWTVTKHQGTSPKGSANCPGGDMIEIRGKMGISNDSNSFSYDNIESLQKNTCKKWSEKKENCLEFDKEKWEKIKKDLPKKEMHFCIDPYEWPNRIEGAPWVMVTWDESKALCESRGKRLCSEEEWTFSCEGEEMLPFPNGYIRDAEKCNIDKRWKAYDNTMMFPRGTNKFRKELGHLWQGHSSGSNPECASPFGIHDMLGNVEELTTTSRPNKYKSILKGGYWAGRKFQCRSSIRSHGELHTFYQQGFRCCADAPK